MILSNKTVESYLCELLSVSDEMKTQVQDTLNSDALRPDVERIYQRLIRKKSEELIDQSEAQSAERIAIAVLSLFDSPDKAKPCLRGMRKFFSEKLQLMPSQVSKVLGAAHLKTFSTLPPQAIDIIRALPFSTAYEMTALSEEDQLQLVDQHFEQASEPVGGKKNRPNLITTQDVRDFTKTKKVSLEKIEAPEEPAPQVPDITPPVVAIPAAADEVDPMEQELLALAPSLRVSLLLNMIHAKVMAKVKEPGNAAKVKELARRLREIADSIEIEANKYGRSY